MSAHLPSSHHHHLRPHHIPPLHIHPPCIPYPLLRDVDSANNPSDLGRSTMAPSAPPLSRGMWAAHLRSTKELRKGGTWGGTQDWGGPWSASQNTSHDNRRGSFLLFPYSFHPTDQSCTERQATVTNNATTPPRFDTRKVGLMTTMTIQRWRRQSNDDDEDPTTTMKIQRRQSGFQDDEADSTITKQISQRWSRLDNGETGLTPVDDTQHPRTPVDET